MIKKSLIIALDACLALYLVLAITAFNKPVEKATVCTEVKVNFGESATDGFLNADEVKKMLNRQKLNPMAQPMQYVSTRQIEETLRQSPFVEQAECYKTQGGHVCIDLVQRMPVLHIMNDRGASYYIDTRGNVMPDTHSASNLIVATGSITPQYAQKVLAPLANSIIADKFWQNQTEQLNVLPDGSLELVPRVGEHIAYLGQPQNIDKKLERLRKFYKYGLNQAGWNKYSYVSVEFDNQIVCKRRPTTGKK